jgi:hypothetical protein
MGAFSCAIKTDGISKKHPQNRTIHEKIRMTRILNKDNLTGHHLSSNKNAIVSDMASLLSTVGAVEGWIGSGSH